MTAPPDRLSHAFKLLKDTMADYHMPVLVVDSAGWVQAIAPAARQRCVLPSDEALPQALANWLWRSTGRPCQAADFKPARRRCFGAMGPEGETVRIEVTIEELPEPWHGLGRLIMLDTKVVQQVSSLGLEPSDLGYALAIQGGADGMWEWNPLTKDLHLSPRLLTILGYPETFEVRSTDEWLEMVHPDDRERYNAENRRHLRRETSYFQCEYRIQRADGQWAWGYSRGLAWFDQDGVARRMAGSITDITSRKQAEVALAHTRAELERLNASLEQRVADRTRELAEALDELRATHQTLQQAQDQLVQSETLASLGRLVAVVAHELNTPIGNSRLAASAMAREAEGFRARMQSGLRRSDLENFSAQILTATHLLDTGLRRAADLISSFKQVAVDQTSVQRRRFDLDEIVGEIRTTLEPSLKRSGCCFVWEVAPELRMDSYPGPLGQVLMNLVENATFHAFDGRAPGTIRVRAAADGPYSLRIQVEDDGRGIEPEQHKKIFEPFFTTKAGAGGTGLGLSIAYNIIVGVLGGKIRVESSLGKGTCFYLQVPCTAPNPSLAEGL